MFFDISEKKLILLGIIVGLLLRWAIAYPQNADLIVTPTSHEKVLYYPAENVRLTDQVSLRFALYDPECDYAQICLFTGKEDIFSSSARDIQILVNGTPLREYSHTGMPYWKGNYFLILIKEISINDVISFTYQDQREIILSF